VESCYRGSVPHGEEPGQNPYVHPVHGARAVPASDFFKGLLGYYDIEYLNLNPNGIFHTSVFVHFCKPFLGIKPHWILFRKFFRVKPLSGILPGYSCKEGGRVEDELLLEFPYTPTRTRSV
jgi:hypothetical protein